ncbi:MAG: hypothetical protein ACE5DX_04820 [Candidatus Dojkabacteria bacterium]
MFNFKSNITEFLNQVDIGGVKLDLFNFGGIFSRGLLAAVGFFMSLFFTFLLVVWVGLSIYAALKIVASQGNPESIQGAMTTIRNIWVGIAMGLVFFVVLSFLGSMVGFGNIYQWANNLSQCGGSGSGEFLFQVVESPEVRDMQEDGATRIFVGCCELSLPIVGDVFTTHEWTVRDVSGVTGGVSSIERLLDTVCPIWTIKEV